MTLTERTLRFALVMQNPFFSHLKICFFKLNNTYFESDRLAALLMCPNMIHFDALDFSECLSEEVISFF